MALLRISTVNLLFCILFSSASSAFPQKEKDPLVFRQEIENSLSLIKNENDLIPLGRLDTLSVASIYIGEEAYTFHTRINSYKESSKLTFEQASKAGDQLLDHNLFIIGIDSSAFSSQRLDLQTLIESFQKSKIILVLPSAVMDLSSVNFSSQLDAVIYCPINDPLSFDLAIQGIFGAIGFKGIILNSIDSDTPLATTIQTNPIGRLKYTVPEELGIDSEQLNNGINEIVQEGLDSAAFPGCQILVAKKGRVIFNESFGYHTYEKKTKVNNSDLYDLASITKVTASTAAMMKLYDQGKYDLDDKFSSLWSDFEKGNKSEMSIREVLAHQARLKPYISYYSELKKKNGKYRGRSIRTDSTKHYSIRISNSHFMHNDFKEKKIYRMIRKSSLNEEEGYRYSGLSFYLYPEIVSKKSGDDFDEFLDLNFFKPLGASTLGFNPRKRIDLLKIVPTEDDDFFRNQLLHGIVHDEGAALMQGISGNAGLFGNANDLAKVWQMLLNGGTYGGQGYLKEETILEFTRCQFCELNNRRGLGFDKPLIEYDSLKSSVARKASPKSFGHSGYTGTIVWADPEYELLFIFLSNRVHPTRDNRKLYELNIRPRIHDLIYSLL